VDRPLVPDIEKIPEKDREYYERFLLSTTTIQTGLIWIEMCCSNWSAVSKRKNWPRHGKEGLPSSRKRANLSIRLSPNAKMTPKRDRFFIDLADRIEALVYWLITLRNVQIWITNVHGYLQTTIWKPKKMSGKSEEDGSVGD
jgi:hypothetical protein